MQSAEPISNGGRAALRPRRSHLPARLDLAQTLSGVALALFIWGHTLFVSSILISKEAMWTVTRMFEGYFVLGRPLPVLVSIAVAVIWMLLLVHALLALRKFPSSYRQYRAFREHRLAMRHADTHLWWWQVVTGFAMFFLASPHLYKMLTQPGAIGPYASADDVWSGVWWPLYLLLAFSVQLHAGIGLYRAALKWGWPGGADSKATRRRLRALFGGITAVMLLLGLLSLATYLRIGYEHRDRVGERYLPAASAVPGAP